MLWFSPNKHAQEPALGWRGSTSPALPPERRPLLTSSPLLSVHCDDLSTVATLHHPLFSRCTFFSSSSPDDRLRTGLLWTFVACLLVNTSLCFHWACSKEGNSQVLVHSFARYWLDSLFCTHCYLSRRLVNLSLWFKSFCWESESLPAWVYAYNI